MKAITLLIDAGNTRIKLALLQADKTIQSLGACDTSSRVQDIAALLLAVPLTHALGVCVAGDAVRERVQAALGDVSVQWLTGNTALPGLRNDYATPHSLGADRWLAAYGLMHAHGTPPLAMLLATFGTATTLDAVFWDAPQRCHVFAGGAIMAGLATAWRSVSLSTAQLPDVSALAKQLQAAKPIPDSTHSALLLGAVYGQIGAVAHMAACVQAAHGDTSVFIAGGAAALIAPYVPHTRMVENPVLLGLAAAAQHLL